MAREAEMTIGRLELVKVMPQQQSAREVGAGDGLARVAEREEVMRKIPMRPDVRQAV